MHKIHAGQTYFFDEHVILIFDMQIIEMVKSLPCRLYLIKRN